MSDNDTSKAEEETEGGIKPEVVASAQQEELELGVEAPAAAAAENEAQADSGATSAKEEAGEPATPEATEQVKAEEAVVPEVAEPVKAEEAAAPEVAEPVKAEEATPKIATEKPAEKIGAGVAAEKPAHEAEVDKKTSSEVPSHASPDLVKKAEEKLKEFERDEDEELIEKVVFINRCAKVVKGGRRFSFSALVVCGDQKGRVGYGFGKANEVADCIRKGSEMSKNSMVPVSLRDNTIPHEVIGEFGGGRVMLRPASPGTGIVAGGGVRAVLEAAGIKDVLAKSMGSKNHANVVKATLKALMSLRTREQIYKLRGKRTKEKVAL